ncbi:hypothetical protein [Streptomyces sp. NPDC006879]|uniref:hypothetical protein n=1 Tax=Streptomyces sp. NPDC006879 TaxID=3364767 RepID=UPI0036A7BC1B
MSATTAQARAKKRRKKLSTAAQQPGPASAERSTRRRWMPRDGADVRQAWTEAVPNPRLRWAAFNASAAAAGLGLVTLATGDPRAGAGLLGDLVVSLVPVGRFVVTVGAAVAAGYVGYKFRGLLGPFRAYACPAAALGAAFWGQGSDDMIGAFLARFAPWPVLLAPLAIAGAAGYGAWALLDRKAADQGLLLRWLARIPLATLTVSALIYAPGALT